MRLPATALTLCALSVLAAPTALARDGGGHHGGHWQGGHWQGGNRTVIVAPRPAGPAYWGGSMGGWYGSWQPPYEVVIPAGERIAPEGPPPRDREEWLHECRRRLSDNGVGGAVIGGVVGGVAGNVIAGSGDKVLGTLAGAAVGAVAGAAIDKAEDRGRARDRCETMLDDYAAYASGRGAAPYGVMMVPVTMVPVAGPGQVAVEQPRRKCVETVTTEYVTYEPRRSRHIPRRAPDKRIRLTPDKRVQQ